jgi:hypothetical protein
MSRLIRFAVVLVVLTGGWAAFVLYAKATFPGDRTPEGAYARIVIALSEGRPRDCFAYLETQAQWASYTIRDFRSKAAARILASYPEPDRSTLFAEHKTESTAKDGADVWLYHAERKGWLARLRKDLSGISSIEVVGERATVQTARGTRYAFRRRDNGIWGLTMFTGELLAEAEKAARDYELLDKAARDYERATDAGSAR